VLLTNRSIADFAMLSWEWKYNVSAENKNYDVAIVLGGLSSFDQNRIEWHDGADRLLYPLEMYKMGNVKKLLLSGGSGRIFDQEDKESLHLQKYLIHIGVSPEDILLDTSSRNTYENALYSKQVLDSAGLSNARLLLVTSAFHMPRSKACYDKIGLKTTAFPVDFNTQSSVYYLDQYIIPDPLALQTWSVLVREIFGYIAYKVKGYA
jgi:uncharacterized SAM-binding protein YcdF (DUF218 family)